MLGEKGRKKPEKAKSTLPLETLVSSLNRYRTVCRLTAMRIFALGSLSKNEVLSRKRRGAKCPRKDTQSLWRTFFSSPVSVKSGARGVGGLQHRALSRPSKVP